MDDKEKLMEEIEDYISMLESDLEFTKRCTKHLPVEKIFQNQIDDLKEIIEKYKY